VRTLRDISAPPTQPHADDDEESDTDYFTGGEKSGLAVHSGNSNPQDQISRILDRARRNATRPTEDNEEPTPQARFYGRGVTLGGDEAPSRVIEDPNASTPRPIPRVERTLHFWADGFSIDDGQLYRYDDPANQDTLNMIHNGRAPLHILNVEAGQEVDVKLDLQKDKPYTKPKSQYKPFAGSGQRLGSPVSGPSTTAPPPSSSSNTGSAAIATPAPPTQTVDDSQPTITLQIRLGDGTRLQSRFNTTHTIGDVYQFVDRATPTGGARAYALMTTFPSKELDNKEVILGDLPDFKRGGVVVQKWK
jgi:UBX domain-containing protein 1